MTLYFKIGSYPGQRLKPVSSWPKFRALRKAPKVGDRFAVKDPHDKWAEPIAVRLLEVRDVRTEMLYVCERF